jgi:hypothetical protein
MRTLDPTRGYLKVAHVCFVRYHKFQIGAVDLNEIRSSVWYDEQFYFF